MTTLLCSNNLFDVLIFAAAVIAEKEWFFVCQICWMELKFNVIIIKESHKACWLLLLDSNGLLRLKHWFKLFCRLWSSKANAKYKVESLSTSNPYAWPVQLCIVYHFQTTCLHIGKVNWIRTILSFYTLDSAYLCISGAVSSSGFSTVQFRCLAAPEGKRCCTYLPVRLAILNCTIVSCWFCIYCTM